MSTRATYEFTDGDESHTLYIHHDGYPEGAATHLKRWREFDPNMAGESRNPIELDRAPLFFAAAALSTGQSIHITTRWQDHGDLEYHYKVTLPVTAWGDKPEPITLEAFAINDQEELVQIFTGPLDNFISSELGESQ